MTTLLAALLIAQQQITLTRELAIGENAASPEYEFAAAGTGALTRAGTLYVPVWEGGTMVQIRQFDHTGRFRRTIGRPGSGPGEYRFIEALALSGDSLLIVFDGTTRRITVFDTAGVYRRSFAVAGGGFSIAQGFALVNGFPAVRTRAMSLPPGRSFEPIELPTLFVRYGLDGRTIDSIPAPPFVIGGSAMGARSLGWRFPFTEATLGTILPDGAIASATNTAYRIEINRAGGRSFVIERQARALPIPAEEREDWLTVINVPGRPGPPMTLPRQKPLMRDLLADGEGRLWVSLYTVAGRRVYPVPPGSAMRPGLSWWEHNAYDLFEPGGRYLGRVDLPPFAKLVATLGDRIWITEETEDGGYLLVRYRMGYPRAQ